MAGSDLRGFLQRLEQEGELLHITEEVDPRFEVAALLKEIDARAGPALFFDRVKGHEGQVVGNLLGTMRRLALAFGSSEAGLLEEYLKRRAHPIPPTLVQGGPVKEVIRTGEIDLAREVPIPTYHERDGGPYITCNLTIARDPVSGVRSMGLHRLQVKGKTRLGIHLTNPPIAQFFAHAEELGQPLEVAIALGVDPVTFMASIVSSPLGDKLDLAGGLRGEPLELVRCETIDLEVPATAEVILEGKILPQVREYEGPFGEVSQCYFDDQSHVIEIQALTRRARPIVPALHPTSREVFHLVGPAGNAELLRFLKERIVSVQAVHLTEASFHSHAILSMGPDKRPGEARQALYLALSSAPYLKWAVAVDDDIDIHNPQEVEWALATRVQPDRDVFILSGVRGSSIDPSTEPAQAGQPRQEGLLTSKIGIDATRALAERGRYERAQVPAAAQQRARAILQRYG